MKGELKLRSYSGEVEHFEALAGSMVTVLKDGAERQWTLESVRVVVPHFLVKFKGLDAPETARKLTGGEILVPRDRAATLQADEYYVADLIGCSLVLATNSEPAVVSPARAAQGKEAPAKSLQNTETPAKTAGDTNDIAGKAELLTTTYAPGSVLGVIQDVWDNAADDLLTVRLTMGKIVQIPFRAPFVGKVDMQARTVELLTAWLLD